MVRAIGVTESVSRKGEREKKRKIDDMKEGEREKRENKERR